ncbi:MAG TPA: SCO family protein [Opitutaceae bacterium]|nr:SCO family protein [Opitutaceae bacterium]
MKLSSLSSAFGLVLVIFLSGLTACSPRPAATQSEEDKGRKIHDLRGTIVGVEKERRTLLVHHDEIPDYMPEMTMEFMIGDADIGSFRENQRISARMITEVNGDLILEAIHILDPQKERVLEAAAQELRQETQIRGRNAYREVGETVPRFTLLNQLGEVVSFDRFRGQRVALNFIFTRCPIATMCPAATERMAALQRAAKERGITDFQLVSITLDPNHDTPAVLKAYADSRGIDGTNFTFLTGPETAIRDLLAQFGVLAEASDNIWKHTLATVLIGKDGKIVHRIDGSTWETREILDRL